MFGTLRKVLNNGWLNNTDNLVIKISTETENSLWQIFSVYHIPATNDYLKRILMMIQNIKTSWI